VTPPESADPRIILALDYPGAAPVWALLKHLSPELCRLKVGKELFTAAGPALIESLVNQGYQVFLDLKFHDIPSTVAKAVTAAANLGVWMVNVHASGGSQMMRAARAALPEGGPLLIAVTVLTSLEQADLDEIGFRRPLAEQVLHLASLAEASGLDGVVCSAAETSGIRRQFGDRFLCVTPGIRPLHLDGGVPDDQRRIMTPEAAMASGSSYLVIGRPVTEAPDPGAALLAIVEEIAHHGRDAK